MIKIKLEVDVENLIIKEANKHGIKVYRIQGKSPSDDGVPDLLLINKYKELYFLEVKHSTKLRAGQELFLAVTNSSAVAKWEKDQVNIYRGEHRYSLTHFLIWFKELFLQGRREL